MSAPDWRPLTAADLAMSPREFAERYVGRTAAYCYGDGRFLGPVVGYSEDSVLWSARSGARGLAPF